jgi:5-methylcytosine-specific restriction endonuclease McrA
MVETKCKQCEKEILKGKTFCDSSCSAKYNNSKREKKPFPICKNCSKELNNRVKVYCDNKCQAEDIRNSKTIPLYLRGEITQRNTLRGILNRERGHICNSCGIVEYNGKEIVLEVNHIDGNPFNNMPDNLELICPNCHSQTTSFKGRNKGNGRKLGKK